MHRVRNCPVRMTLLMSSRDVLEGYNATIFAYGNHTSSRHSASLTYQQVKLALERRTLCSARKARLSWRASFRVRVGELRLFEAMRYDAHLHFEGISSSISSKIPETSSTPLSVPSSRFTKSASTTY